MLNHFVDKKNTLIFLFTIGYLAAFTINAIIQQNYEFLYYTVVMMALILFTLRLHQILHLAFFILFNLSILGFLHLLGGNAMIGDTRLYDFYFIPDILKYDNVVHTYATFIATLALYSMLTFVFAERTRTHYLAFSFILVLMAIGLGTLNELVEFFAVLMFDVQEEVGGYFNNSLDLFFNTIGSLIATLVIYFYLQRPRFIKKINGQLEKHD